MSEEKIKQLEELIELDPRDADLPFMLGKALLDAGKFEQAADRLETAAQMNPRLAAVWRQWGEALRKAGRREDAMRVWTEGIALSEETRDLQAGKEMKVFLKRLEKSGGEAK